MSPFSCLISHAQGWASDHHGTMVALAVHSPYDSPASPWWRCVVQSPPMPWSISTDVPSFRHAAVSDFWSQVEGLHFSENPVLQGLQTPGGADRTRWRVERGAEKVMFDLPPVAALALGLILGLNLGLLVGFQIGRRD